MRLCPLSSKTHLNPFVYLAHNQPHLGLYASDAFVGRSRRGLLGDVMAEIDHSMERILKQLSKLELTNHTLIVFSSDNGPWLRFKDTASHPKYGEARMHVGNAYPFRDGKGSTWEGGHRVPGIFYWPESFKGKRASSSPPRLWMCSPHSCIWQVSLCRTIAPWMAGTSFPGWLRRTFPER